MTSILPEPIIEVFFKTFGTKQKAYDRIQLAKQFWERVYFNSTDNEYDTHVENILKTMELSDDETEFLKLVSNNSALFSRDSFYSILDSLKKYVSDCPSLIIYTSKELDEKTGEIISSWIQSNVINHVFCEFKIDPSVLGGARIVWNNSFYEYSLRERLVKHHKELVSLISNYGKKQ